MSLPQLAALDPKGWGEKKMKYADDLTCYFCPNAIVFVVFFLPVSVSLPQVFYLCFAHLSPSCLLCHGTVNVSDGDRSPPDKRSYTGCRVYFVILPSLSLSPPSLGQASVAFLLYLVAKFTNPGKGEEWPQTNSFATL